MIRLILCNLRWRLRDWSRRQPDLYVSARVVADYLRKHAE